MGIVRKTISVDESQDSWVKAQVESGRFASDSEVHRDALKRAQKRYEKQQWLDAELEKGLNSPLINQSIPEIIAELKEDLRAKVEL